MSDLRERAAIAAYRDALKALVQYGDALVAELARTAAPKVDPGSRLQCNACMGTGVPGAVVTQHGYPQRCEVCGGSGYYAAPKDEPSLRCTAAERELIEATVVWNDQVWRDGGRLHRAFSAALDTVHAERRAASEAKGGEQP